MKARQHRRYDNTPSFLEEPAAPKAEREVRITFDGGTPCNIPRLGYGIGYGSYQIDDRPVVRVSHGRPMSANAAEILTLVRAVEEVAATIGKDCRLCIKGDSTIAVNWALRVSRPGKPINISKGSSPEFRDAILSLQSLLKGFEVEATWHGRSNSVALFGH